MIAQRKVIRCVYSESCLYAGIESVTLKLIIVFPWTSAWREQGDNWDSLEVPAPMKQESLSLGTG